MIPKGQNAPATTLRWFTSDKHFCEGIHYSHIINNSK